MTYKVGSLIYNSESIAIRTGTSEVWDQNTARQWVQEGEHRNAMSERNRNRNRNYTLDRDIKGGIWWHLSSSAELGTGNLGSHCEAVNVMLQGLMSSKVELVQGWWGGVTDSELTKINQQSHMGVTGCNINSLAYASLKLLESQSCNMTISLGYQLNTLTSLEICN